MNDTDQLASKNMPPQQLVQAQKDALIERWQKVRTQIAQADTNKHGVKLLAVSKTKPLAMITTLVQAGQVDFGENYLQEAQEKIEAFKAYQDKLPNDEQQPVDWHYIGHIQRNKTRDIAKLFDWAHTIDREIIAKRLHNQRPDDMAPLNVLIQVNIDDEDSKSGCQPDEVEDLVVQIDSYDRLRLRGLMIIPAKQNTQAFERTKRLFDSIASSHPQLENWDTLSMGMSADLEDAIAAGSTVVRVGSAIFGARE